MKIQELLEAKKPFPIEQKFDTLVAALKKELQGKTRRMYETEELEDFLTKFAAKNKLSYAKERVRPKTVGGDWVHAQGGNSWEFKLIAADESQISIFAGDSNGDLYAQMKISAYNGDGESLKSDKT